MKTLFRVLTCTLLAIGAVSSVNAHPVKTVCPHGHQTCAPSEMVCPKGHQMPLGCGGCDGTPRFKIEDGKRVFIPCIPDFSQCPCT